MRKLDRKRVATQRCGVDVMQMESGSEVHEHEIFQIHLSS